jgi:ABC-2 type transport system ATP-binding protein
MLQLRKFAKSYHDHLVLSVDDLSFSPGIHWVKGPNGSGKSTLFKSIAGIIPFSGDIVLSDINMKHSPVSFRKLVSYAEAEPVFPGFLTPKDLTRFIGQARGSSLTEQRHYIKLFGIDSFFEKSCETFSSGMLKKLSLAMAFFGNPRVVILDEPLITLDEAARKVLFELIRETVSNETIFLISSHQELVEMEIPVSSTYIISQSTLIRV